MRLFVNIVNNILIYDVIPAWFRWIWYLVIVKSVAWEPKLCHKTPCFVLF